MLEMSQPDSTVFLQIQNSKKPDQLISLVLDDSHDHFETQGLKTLFGLDEVWIDRDDFLLSMEDYATVLSFLLETMSAAQDYNLPYSYLEEFEHRGQRYSLINRNGYRVLKKL